MLDFLSIDWGEERFGMAFGESFGGLVVPCNYDCETEFLDEIVDSEIKNRGIKTIVVGLPLNFKGGETRVTKLIKLFTRNLQEKYSKLDIILFDERGSTKNATKTSSKKKNKHTINHLSAVNILQDYFRYKLKIS